MREGGGTRWENIPVSTSRPRSWQGSHLQLHFNVPDFLLHLPLGPLWAPRSPHECEQVRPPYKEAEPPCSFPRSGGRLAGLPTWGSLSKDGPRCWPSPRRPHQSQLWPPQPLWGSYFHSLPPSLPFTPLNLILEFQLEISVERLQNLGLHPSPREVPPVHKPRQPPPPW